MQKELEMSSAEIREELEVMLSAFAKFCETHRLRYFLAYGSLLGAVREQGIIPWDDDVDILMPRPDYDRFLLLYPYLKAQLDGQPATSLVWFKRAVWHLLRETAEFPSWLHLQLNEVKTAAGAYLLRHASRATCPVG